MSKTPIYSAKDEQRLMTELWDPALAEDFEAYVLFVYPWGKANTPLAHFKGPRSWQRERAQELTERIRQNKDRLGIGLTPEMLRDATSSGRGPGKSAFVAWLVQWMMTTQIGSTSIITANTEQQLASRTWAELGKWHTLSINAHWFERSARSLRPAEWFEAAVKRDLKIDTGYYYAQAQLWSEENPDAFAGAHNPLGMLLIYDEASGIPSPIWKVSEGFFTEPVLHRYWYVFSNPRRNTGEFFECFHKARNLWRTHYIDARTVEGTDPAVYQHIITKYGADSDPARVEVYGQFPKHGDKQFISREVIESAANRAIEADNGEPLILGVDVARRGSAKSVLRWRCGRDARSIPAVKYKGLDNMQLAYRIAEWIDKTKPDAVCIDAGNGTGVIDRLRDLRYRVHEVWFGAKSDERPWANQRTKIWAHLRDWLEGAAIDDDPDLLDDLAGPEYEYVGSGDQIMLEPKDSMANRGLASPDDGDALACTFAVKVARRDRRPGQASRSSMASDVDYSIFG